MTHVSPAFFSNHRKFHRSTIAIVLVLALIVCISHCGTYILPKNTTLSPPPGRAVGLVFLMDIAPSALQGRTSKLLIGSESDARKHFLPRVQKELEQAFLDGLLDKGYRPVLLKDRLSNNERFQLHALDWKTSKDVKILNSFASRLCSKHQLSSVIYAHYKVRLLDAAATDDFGEGVLHWFAADGEPLNYTVFTVSRGPPPTDGFLAAIVEYRPIWQVLI